MNGEYIKRMPIWELHTRIAQFLEKYEEAFYTHTFSQKNYDYNAKIISEIQTRLKRFDEYISLTHSLYGEAVVRKDLLINPKMKIESEADWIVSLMFILPHIQNADFTSLETLKWPILEAIASAGKKNGQILWPLRVALSGEEFSPWAFEIAYIIWKDATMDRIKKYFW
jgi:glutamyl/glutaminyl-tRNA synthetase